ncbi:MAG: carbon-nitrogen hydrolase family protein [Isosphaeraceae bacterium]
MQVLAAAIQMPATPGNVRENLDRADAWLSHAHRAGVELAVLPEMFNTGYGLIPDYAPLSEGRDGPTIRHLANRVREWGMTIAAGFVERSGRHLHNSLAFLNPGRPVAVYRKRNLVFWEGYRFRSGRSPVIVDTPWGRAGLAICADMIYRGVWEEYRGQIDLAIVASAWPEFACQQSQRRHWLLGHVGPLSGKIPAQVAADLGVPVVFANQCGPTSTAIPLLGSRIRDRFAGRSSVCDGREAAPVVAGVEEGVVISALTVHPATKGKVPCRTTSPSASAA